MADDGPGGLRVHSDLRLVVGGLSADVVADGSRITVRTDDPARLFAEAAASLPRAATVTRLRGAVGQAGRALNSTGLSARVDGNRGVVIELGRGCASRGGRVLLGTDTARFGSPHAVLPVAAAYLAAAVHRHASQLVAGVAIAALLGGGVVARRRINDAAPAFLLKGLR